MTTPATPILKLPGKPNAVTVSEGDLCGASSKSQYLVRKAAEQLGIKPVIPLQSKKPRRHYFRDDAARLLEHLSLYTADDTKGKAAV